MSRNRGNVVVWILIIGVIVAFSISDRNEYNSNYYDGGSSSSGGGDYSFGSISYEEESAHIDRYDALSQYWDEIKDYASGTETIDACSYESGNCYSLDAEISNGQVETIYFPNGGYLYFSADIDEDGNASDFDQNGDSWDFTVDMDSSMIDDAIYDWASDNDYIIE